jgi:RimJ/RimL family protein N-acetyltransferase
MWFGFEVLRLDRIISLTVPDNKASIRVATKLGADMEKTIKMRGRDYLQFAIDRQTWTRRRG